MWTPPEVSKDRTGLFRQTLRVKRFSNKNFGPIVRTPGVGQWRIQNIFGGFGFLLTETDWYCWVQDLLLVIHHLGSGDQFSIAGSGMIAGNEINVCVVTQLAQTPTTNSEGISVL